MLSHKRITALLLALTLCLVLLSACSGDQKAPDAASVSSEPAPADTEASDDESAPASTDDAEDSEEGGDERVVPEIKSTELTGFMMAFGDPEQTDPPYASLAYADLLSEAAFTFTLKTADASDINSNVTCTVAAKPYDAPDDSASQHVTFTAEYADLQALQELLVNEYVIDNYCDFDDETEAYREWEFAKLTLLYASGESAYHYNNTLCDFTAHHRSVILSFFYDLLDKYDLPFYGHSVAFDDEESFIEAFLGQAPWNELPVTLADGTACTLVLTSDPTGRVFRLEAGEDVYAGNYKLKKREDDGRWRIDLTLTMWPAAYTPMTKGGSVLVDTEVSAAETLVIAKYPNTASLFDPFYGDAPELVFTRNRTQFFDEKPFATEAANAGESTPE